MKKKKKWIIIGIVVVMVISILTVILTILIKNIEEDRENTLKIMDEIGIKYKEFSPLVEEFSKQRTSFYEAKESMLYLETVGENREAIEELLFNYNEIVMKVHNDSNFLQENCNRKYAKGSTNNTCDLFKQGYESVMNYYITDMNMYNTFVGEYNKWIEENEYQVPKLDEQMLSLYKNYIDYDKDGSYLGGK